MTLRIPTSTYRLQFNSHFRFTDARELVPYLHQLGITDVYASPLLQARRGSQHGYDVTDPTHLNSELGTDEDFDAFVAALKQHDMGLLLDIVPNHMAASSDNPWWNDLLEYGPTSQYASNFDIDWHPPSRALENRVLLPILGRPYAQVLEDGEFVLTLEAGAFFVNYFEFKLPVSPRTYLQILEYRADQLQQNTALDQAVQQDFQGLLAGMQALATTPQDAALDRRQVQETKDRLSRLYSKNTDLKSFVDENVSAFNGQKGIAASFALMDRLLGRQVYLVAFWQTPNQGINYRRFFTISDLVGIRIGDPATFDATHAVPLRLANKGLVTGFRIDHIDGLRDPRGYLEKLQERLRGSPPGPDSEPPDFFVVLEKILSTGERLPEQWPVHGTTGYDFLNEVNGLCVDAAGLAPLEDGYREFVRWKTSYEDLVYLKKKQVMSTLLSVEFRSLGYDLLQIALQDRYARDIPRDELIRVLVEITACLPIYRTYVRDFSMTTQDQQYLENAMSEASRRNSNLDPAAFNWLRALLLLEPLDYLTPEQREQRLGFIMKWQQITGPITAKGVEDSALFVYNRLISVNEVGGSPTAPAKSPSGLHDFLRSRQNQWPFSLNATMTHDAKHGEDCRARINVLSEIPQEWNACVSRWSELNSEKRSQVGNHLIPEPNEETLIYQTLLGSWPGSIDESYISRVQEFIVKAGREAMVHTRWTKPDAEHEKALTQFVATVLDEALSSPFLQDFRLFARRIVFHGALNSLAQLVVKAAAPGVTDMYQGSEMCDLRLVDPDNRRPLDFRYHARQLDSIVKRPNDLPELLSNWNNGMLKLFVTQRALQFRRDNSELFLNGEYIPLGVEGSYRDSVFAFARRNGDLWAAVAVPRLTTKVIDAPCMPVGSKWRDTSLILPTDGPREWTNVFTCTECRAVATNGQALALSDVFTGFPVALMRG